MVDFERSRAAVARFEWIGETGSTNDELRERALADPEAWPDLSVLVTDDQTAGRGRLGRRWMAPSGKTLAISLLLRPAAPGGAPLPSDAYGWIPLLAGLAMAGAVQGAIDAASGIVGTGEDAVSGGLVASGTTGGEAAESADARIDADGTGGVEVSLKWPNDVLISGYKVCGVLSELIPASGARLGPGAAVVVGTGLNLTLDEHDLPTLTSTSIRLVTGLTPDVDAVLADYLRGFGRRYRELLAVGGDAGASGLAAEVAARCGTIGAEVRVELPGDRILLGTAIGLDRDGRLLVRDENGAEQAVAAGDVTHLRY